MISMEMNAVTYSWSFAAWQHWHQFRKSSYVMNFYVVCRWSVCHHIVDGLVHHRCYARSWHSSPPSSSLQFSYILAILIAYNATVSHRTSFIDISEFTIFNLHFHFASAFSWQLVSWDSKVKRGKKEGWGPFTPISPLRKLCSADNYYRTCSVRILNYFNIKEGCPPVF